MGVGVVGRFALSPGGSALDPTLAAGRTNLRQDITSLVDKPASASKASPLRSEGAEIPVDTDLFLQCNLARDTSGPAGYR